MTSNRAYRNPMSQFQAASELRAGAGKQWDPQVIEAFFVVERELAGLRENYQPEPKPQRQRRLPSGGN
jgi:HD-GYP domain-containing protein (c-di-GMP phosphodiesterase class II)